VHAVNQLILLRSQIKRQRGKMMRMTEELDVCKLQPNTQFRANEVVFLCAHYLLRKSVLRILNVRSASYM